MYCACAFDWVRFASSLTAKLEDGSFVTSLDFAADGETIQAYTRYVEGIRRNAGRDTMKQLLNDKFTGASCVDLLAYIDMSASCSARVLGERFTHKDNRPTAAVAGLPTALVLH